MLVTLAVLQYKGAVRGEAQPCGKGADRRPTHTGVPVKEAVPRLPAVAASMLQFCAANADGISEGLHVLPGVADLLAALAKRPNTVTGLVTGNLEAIGWAKMAALGLKQHFTTPLVGGCVAV